MAIIFGFEPKDLGPIPSSPTFVKGAKNEETCEIPQFRYQPTF